MDKKTINDIQVLGKTVLLRVDFNVPIKDGVIKDDNRIRAELDNINALLSKGCKLVVFSHLGKVKKEEDKVGKSLAPVAKRLEELLGKEVKFIDKTRGTELENAVKDLKDGEILMFENTRFESGETKNDPELGEYWASLGDVFVNDAFGTAHREHASNVGIANHLDCVSGLLMEKEIEFFGDLDNAKRPMIAILGGAKVSDKIKVIENLLDKVDKILIGGGMAYTFFKAMGYETGMSLIEEHRIELAEETIKKAKEKGVKLVLPVDNVVTKEFKPDSDCMTVDVKDIPINMMGLDIGQKTIDLFKKELEGAKTVIWNGPMGVFEMKNYAKGTLELCKVLADLDDATVIIGGGDSAAAAIEMGFEDKFTHISTGGGASLEYLEGKELPAIKAMADSKKLCNCGRKSDDHVYCDCQTRKIQTISLKWE